MTTKADTEQVREGFETAVIKRMKESGFLEVEVRTECLVRSGDDYQDELINYGWWAYQAGRAALQSQDRTAWINTLERKAEALWTAAGEDRHEAMKDLLHHARIGVQSQDREDAERYRYLRNEAWGCNKNKPTDMHVVLIGAGVLRSALTELAENALDEAIDHARRIEGEAK